MRLKGMGKNVDKVAIKDVKIKLIEEVVGVRGI